MRRRMCCSNRFVHDPGIIGTIVIPFPCCHTLESQLLVQQDSRSIGGVDLEYGNASLFPAAIQPRCVGSRWPILSRDACI